MYLNKSLVAGLLITAATLIFSSCIDDPPTHPEINDYQSYIDLVWELYDQKYVGFDEKTIDWDAVHDEYTQLAKNLDSYTELQVLLTQMVGLLEDKNAWYNGMDPIYSPDIEINYSDSVLMELLEPWAFEWDSSLGVMWGHCVIDTIPYFAIKHFNFFFTFQAFSDQVKEYLDSPGMIIDIRMSDDVSLVPVLQIPSVFADESRTAFLTQYRTGPEHNNLSELSPHSVTPRTWAFTKPIVVLAGEQNIGVAEAFALTMGDMVHVTLIGDTTGGGANTPGYFSQMYWPLWSGRTITCPFARVFTGDTLSFEGIGILPDVYVKTTQADFLSGHDPVLEYAIEWIAAETAH